MYKNRADIAKNWLYIKFSGKMDLEEMKAAAASGVQEAKRLRRGFGTISEIADLTPTSEEARQVMQEAMKTLRELGMGHVVRVVPGSAAVTGNQWQRTSRAVGYVAEQAPSLAEAEALLSKLQMESAEG